MGQKNAFSFARLVGVLFSFSSFLCIAPLLDRCLQNVIRPLCGPVWVFEREGFSLSGAEIYIQGVLLALHQRVKPAECCKQVSCPALYKSACLFFFSNVLIVQNQLCHMLEKLQCLLGEGNACPVIAEPTIEELIVSLSLWWCGMSCVAFLPSRDGNSVWNSLMEIPVWKFSKAISSHCCSAQAAFSCLKSLPTLI